MDRASSSFVSLLPGASHLVPGRPVRGAPRPRARLPAPSCGRPASLPRRPDPDPRVVAPCAAPSPRRRPRVHALPCRLLRSRRGGRGRAPRLPRAGAFARSVTVRGRRDKRAQDPCRRGAFAPLSRRPRRIAPARRTRRVPGAARRSLARNHEDRPTPSAEGPRPRGSRPMPSRARQLRRPRGRGHACAARQERTAHAVARCSAEWSQDHAPQLPPRRDGLRPRAGATAPPVASAWPQEIARSARARRPSWRALEPVRVRPRGSAGRSPDPPSGALSWPARRAPPRRGALDPRSRAPRRGRRPLPGPPPDPRAGGHPGVPGWPAASHPRGPRHRRPRQGAPPGDRAMPPRGAALHPSPSTREESAGEIVVVVIERAAPRGE